MCEKVATTSKISTLRNSGFGWCFFGGLGLVWIITLKAVYKVFHPDDIYIYIYSIYTPSLNFSCEFSWGCRGVL